MTPPPAPRTAAQPFRILFNPASGARGRFLLLKGGEGRPEGGHDMHGPHGEGDVVGGERVGPKRSGFTFGLSSSCRSDEQVY